LICVKSQNVTIKREEREYKIYKFLFWSTDFDEMYYSRGSMIEEIFWKKSYCKGISTQSSIEWV